MLRLIILYPIVIGLQNDAFQADKQYSNNYLSTCFYQTMDMITFTFLHPPKTPIFSTTEYNASSYTAFQYREFYPPINIRYPWICYGTFYLHNNTTWYAYKQCCEKNSNGNFFVLDLLLVFNNWGGPACNENSLENNLRKFPDDETYFGKHWERNLR